MVGIMPAPETLERRFSNSKLTGQELACVAEWVRRKEKKAHINPLNPAMRAAVMLLDDLSPEARAQVLKEIKPAERE